MLWPTSPNLKKNFPEILFPSTPFLFVDFKVGERYKYIFLSGWLTRNKNRPSSIRDVKLFRDLLGPAQNWAAMTCDRWWWCVCFFSLLLSRQTTLSSSRWFLFIVELVRHYFFFIFFSFYRVYLLLSSLFIFLWACWVDAGRKQLSAPDDAEDYLLFIM